jgi:hypothetical protein
MEATVSDTEAKVLKFINRSSRSVICEMRVEDQVPQPGQMLGHTCEWSGRLKPKHISAYQQWILFVTQALADRWEKKVLYALGVSPRRAEFWAFEPGQPPKLIKKANIGIP